MIANGVGAIGVFVFLVFLLPVPYDLDEIGPRLWVLTLVSAIYTVSTLAIGRHWG